MKFVCLDIESTGLSDTDDKLYSISVSQAEDEEQCFGAWEIPEWVGELLADKSVSKIAFNARFDLRFLARNGFKIAGPIIDVMLMAQLVDENQPLGLKPLAERYLGSDSIGNKRILDKALSAAGCKTVAGLTARDLQDPAHPFFGVISRYNNEDVRNTLKLFYVFREKLLTTKKTLAERLKIQKSPLDYFTQEVIPTEQVLLGVELQGVAVDIKTVKAVRDEAVKRKNELLALLYDRCAAQIGEIEEELYQKAVDSKKSEKGKAAVLRQSEKYKTLFNFESGRHLGKLVYEKFGLPEAMKRKTENGAPLTTETYLKFIQISLPPSHPLKEILGIYGKFKKQLKICGTYTGDAKKGIVAKIRKREGGYFIYPQYLQRTNTGRLSGRSPNMQNLSAKVANIKRFFVPRSSDCVFAYFDFSQIELRIAAHLSRDERLVEAYETGLDLHKQTASAVFQIDPKNVDDRQRQISKTCNFLLVYDGSARRLMQELHDKNGLDYSIEDCEEFRDRFFQLYAGYRAYLDKQLALLKRRRFVISECGRIRRLPDIKFGDYLDWKNKQVKNLPEEFLNQLKETPHERLKDPREVFWRCYRKYSHAVKQGYNFPVQSLGASITKRAMRALTQRGFQIVQQVHDSVVIELPVKELDRVPEIQRIAETTYKLSIPLKAEVKLLRSFDEKDVADEKSLHPVIANVSE